MHFWSDYRRDRPLIRFPIEPVGSVCSIRFLKYAIPYHYTKWLIIVHENKYTQHKTQLNMFSQRNPINLVRRNLSRIKCVWASSHYDSVVSKVKIRQWRRTNRTLTYSHKKQQTLKVQTCEKGLGSDLELIRQKTIILEFLKRHTITLLRGNEKRIIHSKLSKRIGRNVS